MSSPGCKALSIVINFFILWSICLRSFLVHFKNGLEYLTRGTAHVFIQLMRVLLQSLVSRTFLIFCDTHFFFFFFYLLLFDDVRFQYFQIIIIFLFIQLFDSCLIWQLCSFIYLFFSTFHYKHGPFFKAKFHSHILAVYSYSLYQSPTLFHFFFANSMMSSMYMRWLIFSFNLVSLKPQGQFLSI